MDVGISPASGGAQNRSFLLNDNEKDERKIGCLNCPSYLSRRRITSNVNPVLQSGSLSHLPNLSRNLTSLTQVKYKKGEKEIPKWGQEVCIP